MYGVHANVVCLLALYQQFCDVEFSMLQVLMECCLAWQERWCIQTGVLTKIVAPAQEAIAKVENGQRGAAISRLNNVLMQMRKNCNHPDLITSALDPSPMFPSAAELLEQCGKMQLLDRLLKHLKAHGHKVLIFSQVCRSSFLSLLNHVSPLIASIISGTCLSCSHLQTCLFRPLTCAIRMI